MFVKIFPMRVSIPSIPMVTCLLTVAVLMTAEGCSKKSRGKWVGTWERAIDSPAGSRESKSAEGKSTPEKMVRDQALPGREWLDRKVGDQADRGILRITFGRDGTLKTETRFAMAGGVYKGRWRWVSTSDDGKTVQLACELKGDHFQTRLTFLEDDLLMMVPPNLVALEKEIKFRRASR